MKLHFYVIILSKPGVPHLSTYSYHITGYAGACLCWSFEDSLENIFVVLFSLWGTHIIKNDFKNEKDVQRWSATHACGANPCSPHIITQLLSHLNFPSSAKIATLPTKNRQYRKGKCLPLLLFFSCAWELNWHKTDSQEKGIQIYISFEWHRSPHKEEVKAQRTVKVLMLLC